MPQQTTSADDIVSLDDVVTVSTPSDIAKATDVVVSSAEKLEHVLETRASNRASGDYDVVVVLEGWAHTETDIADELVLVATHVEDYSADAYFCTGTHEVKLDDVAARSPEEVRGMYITDLVEQIDKTDKDFHDERGETYIPKSAVDVLLVYEPDE